MSAASQGRELPVSAAEAAPAVVTIEPATRAMLDDQASAERVADIYAYLPITTVAMVVGVTVTVSQFWEAVPRVGMSAWLIALFLLGSVRAWMYRGFKHRRSNE